MSPPASSRLISRPRLLRSLEGPWRVALLSAPAGYGKTTLAAQYAEGRDGLWGRLRSEDREPAQLPPPPLAGGRRRRRTRLAGGRRCRRIVGKRTEQLYLSRRDMERDGELLFSSWLTELQPARGARLVILDGVQALAGAPGAIAWLERLIEESDRRVR